MFQILYVLRSRAKWPRQSVLNLLRKEQGRSKTVILPEQALCSILWRFRLYLMLSRLPLKKKLCTTSVELRHLYSWKYSAISTAQIYDVRRSYKKMLDDVKSLNGEKGFVNKNHIIIMKAYRCYKANIFIT